MRVVLSALTAGVLAAASGCVGELTEEGPCTSEGQCRLGFECVESLCLRCAEGGCGGLIQEVIGPDQATLCGPDGACLSVPSGGLTEPTEIYIRRSRAPVPAELDARSLVYEIGPASVNLRQFSTVRIPISPSDPVDDVIVYRATNASSAFSPLDSVPTEEFVDALTGDLGFFVAARPRDGG